MHRRGHRTPKRGKDDQRRAEKRHHDSSYKGNRRRQSPRSFQGPSRGFRGIGHDDRVERKYSPPPLIPSPQVSRSEDKKSNVMDRLGPRLARTPSPLSPPRHRSPSPQPSRKVSLRERGASRSRKFEIKEV